MVKEEIKAFLGNRRISQAVVAQVTGEWTRTPHFKARCIRPDSVEMRSFRSFLRTVSEIKSSK